MANSVDPDETLRSAVSHLGLHCLLRPVRPNTYGKYGMLFFLCVCVCVFLFVLRFYGIVNPMGSCRARSVYLTTR